MPKAIPGTASNTPPKPSGLHVRASNDADAIGVFVTFCPEPSRSATDRLAPGLRKGAADLSRRQSLANRSPGGQWRDWESHQL